ncbi:HlyD family type I secretion periplasmic adaptor subunit [Agaribacterium haliotis]|uniref:HlyD family type I secretion periplasmic adaptor subunit n=1 Tax=Agaribacterium haliotis TaxID=2013869 RepID=UPI000BB5500B|nr:HlyD family type I secretion periplasmic adaptor subunit [Agaribacterium haliotis]
MTTKQHWKNIQEAYRARQVVYLVAGLSLSLILWAAWAELDEVVVGDGKIVPLTAVQKIQSLEGGILKQLLVHEGELVEQGQVLLELDDTRFRANFQESEQQRSALLARRSRLQAELDSVAVDSALPWQSAIVVSLRQLEDTEASAHAEANSQASYHERLQQLQAQLQQAAQRIYQQLGAVNEKQSEAQTIAANLHSLEQEKQLMQAAVASGAVAEIELLKLERELTSMRGQLEGVQLEAEKLAAARDQAISERLSTALEFRTRAQIELAELDAELARLSEMRTALADQLSRSKVRSPVDGKVKDIAVRSRGGVIGPGEAIMEIVPLDDKLIVETRIAPADIAFVKPGLKAVVKFSAYDFVIYGGLSGTVTYVSADALRDEKQDLTYYRAHIETSASSLNGQPIIPGMQAAVDIVSGRKSVLSYWMKPLLRARAGAMREP